MVPTLDVEKDVKWWLLSHAKLQVNASLEPSKVAIARDKRKVRTPQSAPFPTPSVQRPGRSGQLVASNKQRIWVLDALSVFDYHAPVRHSFLPCCTYSTFWPLPIYFDISFVILRILKESFPFQVSITVLLNMKAVELSSRGAPVGAETSTWQPTQTPKRLWSLAALISCTFHNAVQ